MDKPYVIGVLALQGAFAEHITHLNHIEAPTGLFLDVRPVRSVAELEACQALVIPGGESTTIQHLASRTPSLLSALQQFVSDPARPVWGSCAGMILMAAKEGIEGGKKKQEGWEGIPRMRVVRNLYGGQLESFETPILIPALSNPHTPFPTIFIRAPAIHSFLPPTSPSDPPLEHLAILPPDEAATPPPQPHPFGEADEEAIRVVMLRQGRKLVTSFHPELTSDWRVHEWWVNECCFGRAGQ